MNEFKNALRDYVILDGYEFKRDKNELEKVTTRNELEKVIAHCLGQGCN